MNIILAKVFINHKPRIKIKFNWVLAQLKEPHKELKCMYTSQYEIIICDKQFISLNHHLLLDATSHILRILGL